MSELQLKLSSVSPDAEVFFCIAGEKYSTFDVHEVVPPEGATGDVETHIKCSEASFWFEVTPQ